MWHFGVGGWSKHLSNFVNFTEWRVRLMLYKLRLWVCSHLSGFGGTSRTQEWRSFLWLPLHFLCFLHLILLTPQLMIKYLATVAFAQKRKGKPNNIKYCFSMLVLFVLISTSYYFIMYAWNISFLELSLCLVHICVLYLQKFSCADVQFE